MNVRGELLSYQRAALSGETPMRIRPALLLVLVVSIASATVSARAGVNRFTSISPEGSPISAMVIDPSNPRTIYANVPAGVFKSIDAGETWTLSMDSTITRPDGSIMERPVSSLAIDPVRPSIAYAGTQTGEVMKTGDGGASWSPLPGIRERVPIIQLVVDPVSPETLYALTYTTLLQSKDGGVSWSYRAVRLLSVQQYFDTLAIDPSQPSRLYLSTSEGLYVSDDQGQKWSLLLRRYPVNQIVVDGKDSNTIYAAMDDDLASTNDRGKTWTYLKTAGFVTNIMVDPSSSAVYATVNVRGVTDAVIEILVTADQGRTWTPLPASLPDAKILAIGPSENHSFYAVSRGHLFKSENAGADWRRIKAFTAASVWDVLVDPSEPSTLFAATESGVVKSIDSGKTWSDSKLHLEYTRLVAGPRDSSALFALGIDSNQRIAARSMDGGESWTTIHPGRDVTGISVDPSDSAVVYAVLADGVARSTDGGANWNSIGIGQLPITYDGFQGSAIAIDPHVPTTIYAAGNGGVLKSTDSGSSWRTLFEDAFGGWESYFQNLIVDPKTPSTLYAISYSRVYRSDNAGKDWKHVYSIPSLEGTPLYERVYFRNRVAIDPVEPSRLYLATNVGLMRSLDRGEHWSGYNEGLPTRNVHAVTVDPRGNVYASTPRGLFVNSPTERPASRYSVSLRTHSGNFVSAKDCGGSSLNANETDSGPCQTFELFDLNEGQLNNGDPILLRAPSGAFVVAEGGGSADGGPAPVNANRGEAGAWETFVIQRVGGNGPIRSGDSISLRSWSGSFVSAENGGSNGCQCDSRLNANRSRVGVWETFVIEVH